MRALVAAALLIAGCGDNSAGLPDATPVQCTVPVSHPSIQAAIDDAACPTVWIAAGLYDENLVIERDIVIEATGEVVIDGGARDSVIFATAIIEPNLSVILTGLVIQNGFADYGGGILHTGVRVILSGTTLRDNRATLAGGGIFSVNSVELRAGSVVERNSIMDEQGVCGGAGGGIVAERVQVLEGSRVVDNRVECGGARGGGIVAKRTRVDGGSEVARNRAIAGASTSDGASASAGGIACGGAIFDPGSVTVSGGSSVTSNQAIATADVAFARGGGIDAVGCSVKLENSTISDNAATAGPGAEGVASGGGIYAEAREEQAGDVTLTASQVTGNQAVAEGEAIDASGGGISHVAELVLLNSTVSGNRAVGAAARGGGVAAFSESVDLPPSTNLYSSTLVDNEAGGRGGGIATDGTMTAAGSIVWGNAAPTAPDLVCADDAVSRGYNFWGALGGCALGGDADLDQVGADPLLGPLGDNGGPTLSHLPMAGSPAIDGGNPAGCAGPDDALLESDQRGMPRPVGVCDVGAVEVQR